MLNTHIAKRWRCRDAECESFWVDLLNPTPDEIAQVAAESGIQVPSRESLQEIETSSRLRAQGQMLYVSMPLTLRMKPPASRRYRWDSFSPRKCWSPYGIPWCTALRRSRRMWPRALCAGSASVFAALIDGMVDFDADRLEKLSSDLAEVSARAFNPHGDSAKGKKRASRALRESLNAVGTAGDHLSRIRESLLGLQRIIGFVLKMAADWLPPEQKTRLVTAQQDLSSLVDFEAHLSGKTQFLLDAILGFINTEQNDIFKVLTIVSVVGIPPTLIASMYGMNFHNMPELSWRWGYPYGLVLIALSILLPILWFKRRGWW